MKKNYLMSLCFLASIFGFSQSPVFTVDFEGTDPLSNLPAGIISVNPQDFFETPETPGVMSDSIVAFIGNNSHYFIEEGGDLVRPELFTQRGQFDNVVKDVSGNKLLQTDYTGHVIIDETALGTGSYSVRLNLSVFGHRMGGTDCGIFTITGNDGGTYKDDRLTSRNGGFTTGLGDGSGVGGASGFPYGQTEPAYREVIVTYDDTDKFYRVYIEGVEQILSESIQTSGDWTDRKFYIGFSGRNSVGNGDGISHIDTATGVFTSNGVRNDGRVSDLQMRMDNIEVYQTALSQANVTTLLSGGTLSSSNVESKQVLKTYPNPVKDILYFSNNNVTSVEVFNTLGVKVLTKTVNNNLDMTNLSSGIYLVKAYENDINISTIKVVKK